MARPARTLRLLEDGLQPLLLLAEARYLGLPVCCCTSRVGRRWQPPGIANPIGATYWHTISSTDDVVYRWALSQEPLRQRDGWDDRVLTVLVPEPEHGGDWLAYMRAIRVDLPTLHDYATKARGVPPLRRNVPAPKLWPGLLVQVPKIF